jgi:hypothetical protein
MHAKASIENASAPPEVPFLKPEQIEKQPVSEGWPRYSEGAKQKFTSIEAAMANASYERARARALLALIAPTVDEVSAAYFDGIVEKVLREARQNEQRSDEELVSTLLDAVARKYFAMGLGARGHEQGPDRDHEQSSDRDHEQSSDRDHEQSSDRDHEQSSDRDHEQSPGRDHEQSSDDRPPRSTPTR